MNRYRWVSTLCNHTNKPPTFLFPAVPNELLGDLLPARLGAEQLQLGHDGQVVARRRPQLVEQEAEALDHRRAHLLVGAPLLLVGLGEGNTMHARLLIRTLSVSGIKPLS